MAFIFSRCALVAATVFFLNAISTAQSTSNKKYPSLFWEITGNGLKKPSYLFGTMHVSSKMVFHLSDSFYHAMRNTEVVALELNPEQWQGDMFKMQKAQANIARFGAPERADYLNEKSFQLTRYEDNLKRALSEEPTVVNSLLYRSYQQRADFEENTYLDLYIYQTGRKMGKAAAGVEDYWSTEKLMLEAYADMAKEKVKRTVNTDGESMFEIERKMQEAYRKGDLDMLDSLDIITVTSPAFNEKFLYKRNEIQAHSIDTILKSRSLFVGVGAAHLPGQKGIIEILRRKGYHLRPIFMADRDAQQKEQVDKMKVPVIFTSTSTDDGMVQMKVPGELFKREEARSNESWQYADMNNGSYYMLTRVRHHAAMFGESQNDVLKKTDSILYENIPGKILKKTSITRNGYPGFDITNKTRRGDIQRYNIFVTPFEVLVFKMSGTDTYVEGVEAENFFNSVSIDNKQDAGKWKAFEPSQGGFSVNLPQAPNEFLNRKTEDRIDRWEYEAVDKTTGDAYMVWKKSVHNSNFLEEDTFDISLVDESFLRSELISKQLSRLPGKLNGFPFLDSKYLLKNGEYIRTRAFIRGPHYYLLAAKSNSNSKSAQPFFDSFKFTSFKYGVPRKFVDTILNVDVLTTVAPGIDTTLRSLMEKASADVAINGPESGYTYWPKSKNAIFKSDSTGEAIMLSVETFPKYYFISDSSKFWRERLDERKLTRGDMVLKSKDFISAQNSTGYKIVLTDTNTNRQLNLTYILKDNSLFKFSSITDTLKEQSALIKAFDKSFKPLNHNLGPSIFENKVDLYFSDYNSSDSVTKRLAQKALTNISFGKDGIDKIVSAINNLKYGDKDYFDLKTKFINELGFITDSCCNGKVLAALKDIYKKTADTSYFQNAVFASLARLKTKESYTFLKQALVQDPPLFDNVYEYSRLFNSITDSLPLAKSLLPEIFQLAQLDDYKPRINSLLRQLVDSGFITAKDYEPYFNKLYFDAKIQLRKQQGRDEKIMEKEINDSQTETNSSRAFGPPSRSVLPEYAMLLMPFYDKQPTVPGFFKKLLQSKDQAVQLDALILLIKNSKPYPDTLLNTLAANDLYRSSLLDKLTKIKKQNLFPLKYKTQVDVARSMLLNSNNAEKFAAIELVGKRSVETKGATGNVYFFRYKLKKEDDWQMGISGLQPAIETEVSATRDLVRMTNKKLKESEPVLDQFESQLKLMLFAKHKSARQFAQFNSRNVFSGMSFEIGD